ncbi:MAG TPA: hypothetical protein VHA52_03605 [Candidatus Babeliaceae bacterium]|nr:hypothetical protein [Candidatus Babeliaceae bacterium]
MKPKPNAPAAAADAAAAGIESQQLARSLLQFFENAATSVTKSGDAHRVSSVKFNLYGNPDSILPKMPTLVGTDAVQFSDWMNKALSYFEQHSLMDLVTQPTENSFKNMIRHSIGVYPKNIAIGNWRLIQGKVIGAIKSAVTPALGLDIFASITREQEKCGKVDEIDFSDSNFEWIKMFKVGNANYVWETLKQKQLNYTAGDHTLLCRKITNLKFDSKTDPVSYRRKFLTDLNELRNAGTEFTDRFLMSVWLDAIPDNMGAMRQGLAARLNNETTWENIYSALKEEYTRVHGNKIKPQESKEQTNFASESWKKKHKNKAVNLQLKNIECFKCGKKGHKANKCRSKRTGKPKDQQGTETSDTEDEPKLIMKRKEVTCYLGQQEILDEIFESEISMAAREENEDNDSYLFLLDSGATSHVATSRKMFTSLVSVPEIQMTTALKGINTVIRERGTVPLSDSWKLIDVAFIKNGSANLISEGKIVDAGFRITKDSEAAYVIDPSDKKVILKFKRVNKLWIYTTGGDNLAYKKPSKTIVSRRRENNSSSSSSSSIQGTNSSCSGSSNSQVNGRDVNSQSSSQRSTVTKAHSKRRNES